jgi:methionyl-tRNA formyltransferase
MNTLFFGTPQIAVPFLERLATRSQVAVVITNPDQPAGRGYELKASEVKQAAERLKLPVLQPQTLKDPALQGELQSLKPELGVAVAYGKLLPPAVLSIPKYGFLNVHFSLLPAYRGAAPMQWALINGEKETGVSLFWLDAGMDTGPLLLQKRVPIDAEDDGESLRQKLVTLGVSALDEALTIVASSGRVEHPQQGVPSRAPMLTKDDGRIRWEAPAQTILNLIRGTTPWPGAYTTVAQNDKPVRLKIVKAAVVSGGKSERPGTVARLDSGKGFVIECGKDLLAISFVQPEGKKPMSAWDFWQGARLQVGAKLI